MKLRPAQQALIMEFTARQSSEQSHKHQKEQHTTQSAKKVSHTTKENEKTKHKQVID